MKGDNNENADSPTGFVYLLSLLAAIGGFLFGYDTGIISGAMLLLKSEFNLSNAWQEAIVSITVAAAALFSVIGGFITDRFGRRPVIFAGSAIFTLGGVFLACSVNKAMLLVGRFIVGAGVGLASVTVPMYIAEAAPLHMRGRLVTMNNLFITGGQFVAALIAGGFSYVEPNGWRYMLGIAAVPSAIQFVGFIFMPESPRWLMEKGRFEEAKKVLSKLVSSTDKVEKEFQIILRKREEDEAIRKQIGSKSVVLTMLTSPYLRRALIVGCALQMFQQISGINTVMYYSATIIQMAGIKSANLAIWLSSATAGTNFLFTFVGVYCVERYGRRPLTLISLFAVSISLIVLGVGFQLMASFSPPVVMVEDIAAEDYCSSLATCNSCVSAVDCGYCFYESLSASSFNGSCLPTSPDNNAYSTVGRCNYTLPDSADLTWAYDWCPTNYFWLPIFGLVLYLVSFAPGMGPMPWAINSEIYPQWGRSAGNAMATATNWIFNLIVSMTFLSLLEAITKQGAYFFYAGVSFVGFVFFIFVLPETKDKPLEEVELLFIKPWIKPTCCNQEERTWQQTELVQKTFTIDRF